MEIFWRCRSGQICLVTVDIETVDKIVRMNYTKTLVLGELKAVIAGMGYSGQIFDLT